MKTMCIYRRAFLLPVSILWVLPMASCEQAADNFYEDESPDYSVYGSMAVGESENYIRVMDVNQPHIEDSTGKADVTVRFKDLTNNETELLEDTLIGFDDFLTQNFKVNTPIRSNHVYRVSVDNGTQKPLTTVATAPGNTELRTTRSSPPQCSEKLQWDFHNVSSAENIHLEVGLPYNDDIRWAHVGGNCSDVEHLEDRDIWRLTAHVYELFQYHFPASDPCTGPSVTCSDLDKDEIYLHYFHLGAEYEHYYKSEEPVDPAESPTIENGIGFLGVHHEHYSTFAIDTSEANQPH